MKEFDHAVVGAGIVGSWTALHLLKLGKNVLLLEQDLFRQQGGTLWDNCQVYQIILEGDKVKVKSAKGDVIVRSVVVCAGSWTQKLLTPHLISSLPLQPTAVNVFYWKEKVKGVYSAETGFPGLLELSNPPIYALPSLEYPGLMKVCFHGGVRCDDPDERDKIPTPSTPVNTLKDYIKDHIPLLETEPAIVEKCMYTVTPDEIFIIDTLPEHKNIVIGAGFSGTGFKTSPTVGRLLSEMAVEIKPFLDVTPFRLSRFESQAGQ